MMEKIYLQIPGTDSSVKYHVPFVDECRLVAAYVCNTTSQSNSDSDVTFGKNGDTVIMEADLQDADARTVTTAQWNDSASDAEKNQVFDLDTPLEIDVNLADSSKLTICLVVDPFVIGARTGF